MIAKLRQAPNDVREAFLRTCDEDLLSEILNEERKAHIRDDLNFWCTEALAPMEMTPARHHRLLNQKLMQVADGSIDRLMVFMPPGSAKSTYVSKLFPAWWFNRHPTSAVIAASHSADLAEHFGRHVRNIVDQHSDELGYSLSRDSKAAWRWETSRGGEYYSAGVLASITGRRCDLGLIDDPVKSADEAVRDTVRERIWDWYQSDFYTRLKPGARIIIIMTRWHEDDLAGRLIDRMREGGDQWEIVSLPALANPDGDPLGREAGEALWPEWESKEALERKRKAVGERVWQALYQQDPKPPDDEIFFPEHHLLIDNQPVAMPSRCDAVFVVIDTAVKTGKKHDSTAAVYWAFTPHKPEPLTILGYSIQKIEGALLEVWLPTVFEQLEHFAKVCGARSGSLGAYIEDKTSGTILLQQTRRRGLPAIPIDSKLTAMGKTERAISVSGYVFRGMVKITEEAYNQVVTHNGRTCNHLLDQIKQFRIDVFDASDDVLDCFTYGIAISLGDGKGF